MRHLNLTIGFYLSIETKRTYRAKSGRVTLPGLASLLPAGLKDTFRRMAEQGEIALAVLGIAGRSIAWGLS